MSLPLHSQQVTPQSLTGKVQATLDNHLRFLLPSCSLAPTRHIPSSSSVVTTEVFLLLSAAETLACPLHPKPSHFLRNLLFPSLFTTHLSIPSEILSSVYKNACLSLIKTKQASSHGLCSFSFSPFQPLVLRSCLCLVSLILYLPHIPHPHHISLHAINVFLKLHYQGHQWSPYCKILGHCSLHSFPPLSGFDTIVHHLLNCFLCLVGLSFYLSSYTS